MHYRILFLSALICLTACSDSSDSSVGSVGSDSSVGNNSNDTIAGTGGTFIPPKVDPVTFVSPGDHVVEDMNVYSGTADAGLELAADEAPAVKNHETMINGQLVKYTARAGHLTAYAPKDSISPEKKDAQASIFYMAYTRDDQPKDKRPVTFFFNGGPGSASVWLHLGSWAPKRLKTNIPHVPDEYLTKKPDSFPWIDNEETLLDKTDLVFVDPVGTGLSQAVAPYKNSDFWGMEVDARIDRDFISRFINFYNRQSSPKYLYGESYGGIRIPIMANLMEAAGTSNFEPDKTGKKPIVLSGVVLNSPILNYDTNCGQGGDISCAGFLPTEAMVADYYKKGTKRGAATALEYVDALRTFIIDKYNPARKIWYTPLLGSAKAVHNQADFQFEHLKGYWDNPAAARAWALVRKDNALSYGESLAELLITDPAKRTNFVNQFIVDPFTTLRDFTEKAAKDVQLALTPAWLKYPTTLAGIDFLKDMTSITGLDVDWVKEFEISPNKFGDTIMPDKNLGIYDARVNIPKKGGYDITFYEDEAFAAGIKAVLPDMFNYHNASEYSLLGDEIRSLWQYERENRLPNSRSSLPDLVGTLNYDPSVKMLTLHGYYDLVTPFHQTELDLASAGLSMRIPVKNLEGGHMFYYSEEARAPAKKVLDEFYDAPAYSPTPAIAATSAMALN